MDFKKQVEDYLKHDRSLIGGRNLYNKLPGKSLAIQNTFSRLIDTPQNIDKVAFQLCKLAGIHERNRKILMQKPVVKKTEAFEPGTDAPAPALTPEDSLLAFDPKTAKYQDAKKLAKTLELKPKSQKKADVYKALSDARAELVKKK